MRCVGLLGVNGGLALRRILRRLGVLLAVALCGGLRLAGISRGIILLGQALVCQALVQVRRQAGLGNARCRWRGLNAGRAGWLWLHRLGSGRALLLRVIGILIGIGRLGRTIFGGPTVRWGAWSV